MHRIARRSALILGLAVSLVSLLETQAQQLPDPRVADLVRAGKLRVGLGVIAPHWAIKDRQTGELRGVAVEVARALASRVGAELVAVEYPSPTRVLDGAKTGVWDVGFLGVDSSRADLVDFAPSHIQVDATYLVAAGSPIHKIADADRAGIRIAVSKRSVEEGVLRRLIQRAELLAIETPGADFEALRTGNVDVLATPRPRALQLSAQLPGSRVLDDSFHRTFGAMAVPKGHGERLAYISEFVEQAKASGLVQRAIERVDARGIQVAQPGYPPL